MVKKQSSFKKIKKKKWYSIMAPRILGGRMLGESLVSDSADLKGRTITANLMNVLGEPKKQSINIQFLINRVKEGQALTEIIKYELSQSYIKRQIRRGRSKIEDSFLSKTADNKRVRIKPMVITNGKVFKSVETKIRLALRGYLKEIISKNTFEKTVDDLIKIALQRDLSKKLSSISPTRTVEIKIFKIYQKGGLEASDMELKDEDLVEAVKVDAKVDAKVEKKEVKKETAVKVEEKVSETLEVPKEEASKEVVPEKKPKTTKKTSKKE